MRVGVGRLPPDYLLLTFQSTEGNDMRWGLYIRPAGQETSDENWELVETKRTAKALFPSMETHVEAGVDYRNICFGKITKK